MSFEKDKVEKDFKNLVCKTTGVNLYSPGKM